MERVNKFLKIAGTLTSICSLIFIKLPVLLCFFLALGLYLLFVSSMDLKDKYKHSVPILIVGILLCLTNVVAGILTVLAYDDLESMKRNGIKAPPSKSKKIDPEAKRIDILLKLGVAMVFISGILFATTSWSVITNPIKLIVLLLLSILFLGLSIFSEKKLKIENTTKMYWLLSISFFVVTTIGLFYFAVFGDYLTYSGEGSNIALSITFLVTGLLSFVTAHKFDNNFFRYLGYFCTFAFIDFLSTVCGTFISEIIIIVYLLFFGAIILFLNKEKPLYKFSRVMLYLFPIFIFSAIGEINDFILLAASVLNVVELFIVSKKGNLVDKIIPFILIFLIIIYTSYAYEIPYRELIIIAFTSLVAIINRLKLLDDSNANIITTSIMQAILMAFLFLLALIFDPLEALLMSIVFLIYILVAGIDYFKDNSGKIEFYEQPIAILYFIIGTMAYLEHADILTVNFLQFASIITLVYAIMHFASRIKVHKIEYFVFTISTLIITALCNVADPDAVANVMLVIPSTYLVLYFNNKNNILRNWSYIILLFVLSTLILLTKVLFISPIINSVILLWLFVILLIFLFKDNQLRMINYFAVGVPLYALLTAFIDNYIYSRIMMSILGFYFLYLLLVYVFTSKEAKNIAASIGISIILLHIFFINDVVIGVYIGVIGISLIALSFLYKEYSSLFWVGVVVTLLNIIYQLKDLWTQIPFYLYLLICGLGIIGFVTYKELKRTKK